MTPKIFALLEKLKNNFSKQLLDEVMDVWENGTFPEDLHINKPQTELLLNGQDSRFYASLANLFVEDLNVYPELYFLNWESILENLTTTLQQFLDQATKIADDTDAASYINGIKALNEGFSETALYYFNEIESNVACYFIGLCYLELNNYENAIKNNLIFLKHWNETIESMASKNVDLTNNNNNLIVLWNIYNDLGYLYNQTAEYQEAKEQYERGLKILSLEENFEISKNFDIGEYGNTDFRNFINNYLLCLEKKGHYTKCIEVLDFVTSKLPENTYYLNLKQRFEEKNRRVSLGEDIIRQSFPTKKPFNVAKFEQTKLLAKEKVLEDMILGQIKNGYMVFGKKLEVYQDALIYGRQYPIRGSYGILDLLLVEKGTQTLYVVELKRNEAGIEVVEQIERYMKGLTIELGKTIKGIICLHKSDEQLRKLVRSKPDIELFTYYFDFKPEE